MVSVQYFRKYFQLVSSRELDGEIVTALMSVQYETYSNQPVFFFNLGQRTANRGNELAWLCPLTTDSASRTMNLSLF